MIYKMELSDSVDDMIFELLEVPIEDKDVTGIADNTTIDGNVFRDYLWLKKQWTQKWSIMCQDEYNRLRGFWLRQFGNAEVPFYRLFYGDNVYEDKNTFTVNGFVQIDDDAPLYSPLSLTHLYGNATQETIDGKNLFDINNMQAITRTTVDANGWATATVDNTSGTTTVFCNFVNYLVTQIPTGTACSIVCEIKSVSGAGTINTLSQNSQTQFGVQVAYPFSDISANQVIVDYATTKNDYTGVSLGTRTYVRYGVGESGSITYRMSLIVGTSVTPQNFVYTPFVGGSDSPNPDYPQPIYNVTGGQTVKITGKNLMFNHATSGSSQGITYTVQPNGDVNITAGTATGTSSFVPQTQQQSMELPAGTWTVSTSAMTSVGQIRLETYAPSDLSTRLQLQDGDTGSTYATITTTQVTKMKISIIIARNGQSVPNMTIGNFMLEKSATPTSFEPYQSTTYPINLGKNLVEEIIPETNIDSSGKIITTYQYQMNLAKVEQGKTYTMSIDGSQYVYGFFMTKPVLTSVSYDGTRTVVSNVPTFTAPITGYVAFRSANAYDKPQLELGNKATSYSAYKTPIELAKIDTYQDYIWNDDGTWYIHKEIGKVVLDGSAGIGQYNQTNNWLYVSYSSIGADVGVNDGDIMSDYFTGTTTTYMSQHTTENGLCAISSNNIFIRNTDYTTTADYRTWLASHNTTVYYALATPTDTEITDANLIEQLDHIYSLYGGVNNVMLIPSGGAQGEIAVKYRLNYEEETDIVPRTPVVLTLTDGGVINPCGCRENIQLVMRETEGGSES